MIKSLRKKTLVEVLLDDEKQCLSFNLSDVGFGVSQILPIIVQGFYADDDSLILIEQPEIHLHPKLQAEMGNLLVEIAKSGKQLIIETHSEHLLLRLQRLVAEGRLSNDNLAIYYFKYGSAGTKIQRISIDKFGQFENWPKGFFEEDIEESFAITEAMLKQKRKG